MTTTPPEAPPGPESGGQESAQPGQPGQPGPQGGPRATSSDIKDLARLRRTTGPNKKIAGVAGGLARHLDIDPLVLRVVLVVLVFFGGAGLIVYGACWLLVPEDGDDQAPFNFDDRTRTVALVIAGIIATLALLGDTMGGYGFPWPLAIVALIVLVVVSLSDRRQDRPRVTAPPVPHTTYQATYGAPPVPQTQQGWVQPEWQAQQYVTQPIQQPAPRYRNPRKRGPILFWFTLALSALGIGILGMVDAAGAGVADSSYPALVVGICGAMLLVGAFFGRAGGLILIGLLAAVGMAGATADSRVEDRTVRTPLTADAVQDTYKIGAGELVLDLTKVTDPENLDGRRLDLRVGAGSIEVILPAALDVEYDAHAGLGDVQVFTDSQDGPGVDMTGTHSGGVGVPELALDIQVGLGEIDVHTPTTNGAFR
jgi:phage shock protein PspC (stress-responsive transcriptional regulator)